MKNFKLKPLYVAMLSWLVFGAGQQAMAVTTTWNGSTDDDWFEGTNWDTNNVPTNVDDAIINNGTVDIQAPGAVSSTSSIGNTSGTTGSITVDGAGSTWTNSGSLTIGFSGSGSLGISAGGAVSSTFGTIGSQAGSDGSVTVTGTDSSWTNSGNLIISNSGSLVISAGAAVSNLRAFINGNGSVTVAGTGSTWINTDIFIGNNGIGSLDISAGAAVSNFFGTIGNVAGSDGSVTVAGTDSSWTNSGELTIGNRGSGSLDISAGGLVSNTAGTIGSQAGSDGSVTVAGTGSTWTNSSSLVIGDLGIGSLGISGGAAVSNTTGTIGNNAGVTSSVTVAGTGSTWTNSSSLTIGNSGIGSLVISDGAAVSNTTGTIGNFAGSVGSVTVGTDSTWTNSANLFIGFSGSGSLDISGGAAVSNSTGLIGFNTGSDGSVTVAGTGSTWTNSTNLFIGFSGSGSLDISGGGAVSNTLATIGDKAGSVGSVKVAGTGSTWTNSISLVIGDLGSGSLDISGGAAVSNTTGTIGNFRDSVGSVTVGTDSTWTNSSSLVIGNSGSGSLGISGGGAVSNTTGIIGDNVTGSVTVDGTGSSWTNSSSLVIGNIGSGSLDISNAGVVNVTGTMTLALFGGSIGTLIIGAGGSAGVLNTASVDGGTGTATLNFNHTDANYFFTNDGTNGGTAITITGTTAVNHIGTGKTTLTGTNTYSGGTTVSGGTLQGTTTSLQGNITNNANVTFDQTTTGTYSGVMDGTGSLTKSNTGTVILSGTNTYSGTTTISGGTLTLLNGAAIADTGAVNIIGGTLDIDTAETIGSLTGAGIVNLDAGLTVGDATNTTYAGVIQGGSSLTKQGAGTLTLSGTNTYSGATTINAGTLFVNGSNSISTTTVNAGGILGGSGTVGSVNINGGTFAPGNSIGTTNVTGNVDFTGGGLYQVEVDATGNSDLINATGTATLTSGIVQVLPEAGTYNLSTDYTILTAAGGLGGTTFNSVTSNLVFLDPTLSYDANNVFLNLTRNDVSFSSVAETPNQTEVSNVLTTLATSNPTEMEDLINNFLSLTDAGARQAFDSLSGVQHTHGQAITKGLSQQFLNLLLNRGSQSRSSQYAFNSLQNFDSQNFDPMSGPLFADNSDNWQSVAAADSVTHDGLSAGDLVPGRGWWLSGFGGFGDIDTTTNVSGADYDTIGLAFGVDTEWRDIVVGVAGSYASSDVDTFGGDLDIDSFQAATYASWQRRAYYLNAALGFAYHDTDSSRVVTVGTTSSIATSDYDSYNISAAVETGKDIALSAVTTLTPFIGVDYSHSSRDDFTETGAGASNLSVDDKDEDSLRSKLGLRISHDITTEKGTRITPAASVAYVREYMDSVSRLDAGFAVAPAPTFRIDGTDLDRDRVQLGLGVTGQINERTTLNIAYIGELADSDDNHNFAATVRFVW